MSNENPHAERAVPFAMTLQVRDGCLCLHAQRAARVLARRFDEVLKPIGLTNGQFSLLMSLNRPAGAGVGQGRGPCGNGQGARRVADTAEVAMRDVATLLGMDRTTLTAAAKTLERRGLLLVVVDAADRRARFLRLTEAGLAVLAEAVPIWKHEHALLDREFHGKGAGVSGLLQDFRLLAG